jgi:hypothetical protein
MAGWIILSALTIWVGVALLLAYRAGAETRTTIFDDQDPADLWTSIMWWPLVCCYQLGVDRRSRKEPDNG